MEPVPSQQKPCAEQLHHLPEAHSFQIQFLNQAKLRLVAPDILEPYLMADPVLEVMKIRGLSLLIKLNGRCV